MYCGKCGGGVTKDESAVIVPIIPSEPPKGVEQAKASETSSPQKPEPPKKKCAWCSRDVNAETYICPYCGKNPWGPWGRNRRDEELYDQYVGTEGARYNKASSGLTIGGVMALLAGVLALGQGLLYIVVGQAISSYAPSSGYLCLCGGLDALFGIVSIGAGVFALQRKHFGLAVVGAVFGMLGLGLIIGFVLGLIAVIFIAICREEFRS